MKSLLTLVLAAALSVPAMAFEERNPVGEKANYKLDKASARTTSMIREGTAVAQIIAYLPNQKAFQAKLTYDLMIDFVGRKAGEKEIAAPEEYFKPEFLEKLRVQKKIVLPNFTVTHMGFGNARNPDGKVYNNCDKVLISDIKQIDTNAIHNAFYGFLQESFMQVAAVTGDTQIENLKILAHVAPNVPVLGAVKIDLSGKASGFDFKAGFDYLTR